jgi:polyisoprenoid-binding protein YceI
MKQQTCRNWRVALGLSVTVLSATAASAQSGGTAVEVRGGTAAFDAATNVSAIGIHGKSAALEGRARVRDGAKGFQIQQLEARVPVKTLNTGMGLRDEHMRKHVFTTADGQLPDLRFSSRTSSCSGSDKQATCEVKGELAMRGTAKPFTITLKVTRESGSFRAVGDGIVKLSTYGIPAPSQLGVTVVDDVKLHLDFVARTAVGTLAQRGGK